MIIERKSKIVGKIADNKSEPDFLKMLFETGVDLAWLNTAHQGEEEAIEVINKIRSVRPDMPILIDTKGPEVRTKHVEHGIEVKAGDYIIFTGDTTFTGENVVHVSYENFHKEIPVGEEILYNDAVVGLIVEEILENGIKCVVKNAGVIKNKKSLNVPGVHIQLPALSKKDIGFVHFCAKNGIDFITHSFVRNVDDLNEIKNILKEYPDYNGKIIAKIENREGFDNLESILDNCEGMMVARGDLGAEVPLEELPYMQKKMVEAANRKGKYSIVATQVLHSMVHNPRPTRAEVTDCSNAILDGSGAVSMSDETAFGDYPGEAVNTMSRIMSYTEKMKSEMHATFTEPTVKTPAFAKAKEIVTLANEKKVKAIVVAGLPIEYVQAMSAYRPNMIIVPTFEKDEDVRDVMLAYAVRPALTKEVDLSKIVLATDGFLKAGDSIVFVSKEGDSISFGAKNI